jgi:hypothetical protein
MKKAQRAEEVEHGKTKEMQKGVQSPGDERI